MSDRTTGDKTAAEPSAPEPGAVKVIKRYTNRKLYDTVESRYVTLEEIAEMVKNGLEVRIVDNRTQADLTSVTLAQIIFEEEKREGQMPLTVLKRIIRGGGSALTDFFSERVTQVGKLKEEAETRVNRLFKRDEAQPPRATPNVREVFSQSQRALEEWQRRVDERVRTAIEAVTGLTQLQRDLARLHERLDGLEKKLDGLEKNEG